MTNCEKYGENAIIAFFEFCKKRTCPKCRFVGVIGGKEACYKFWLIREYYE